MAKENDDCDSCVSEARAAVGIYDSSTKVPRDKLQAYKQALENESYRAHG